MKKVLTLLVGIGFIGAVLMRSQGFAQSYLEEVRACQYLEQGKIDEAIHLLDSKLKRYPRNFDCHLYLGLAYYHLGQTERGQAQFDIIGLKMKVEKYSPKKVPLVLIDAYTDVQFVFMCDGKN